MQTWLNLTKSELEFILFSQKQEVTCVLSLSSESLFISALILTTCCNSMPYVFMAFEIFLSTARCTFVRHSLTAVRFKQTL